MCLHNVEDECSWASCFLLFLSIKKALSSTLNFQNANQDKKSVTLKNFEYYKKVVKPSSQEIKNHKEYLKLHLKKNYF